MKGKKISPGLWENSYQDSHEPVPDICNDPDAHGHRIMTKLVSIRGELGCLASASSASSLLDEIERLDLPLHLHNSRLDTHALMIIMNTLLPNN
jgi:hypothetical protein